MKKLAVVVTTAPTCHLTQTAYQVINNANNNDTQVIGVFFYQSGVLNASKHLAIPSDEFSVMSKWTSLSNDHNIPLYLCSTAAEKFGLVNTANNTELINESFTISGLGELVQLTEKADRVVQL